MAIPLISPLPALPILGIDTNENFSDKVDAAFTVLPARFVEFNTSITAINYLLPTIELAAGSATSAAESADQAAYWYNQTVAAKDAAFSVTAAVEAARDLTITYRNEAEDFRDETESFKIAAENAAATAIAGANTQTFDESGSWSPPAGLTSGWVFVQVWGPGGGGSGGIGQNSGNNRRGGAGGGGGAYNEGWYRLEELTHPVAVTIGAKGLGGDGAFQASSSPGTDAGTTSFGTYLSARGGKSGGSPVTNGGDGGDVWPSGSPTALKGGDGGISGLTDTTTSIFGGGGGGYTASNQNAGSGSGSWRGGPGGGGGEGINDSNVKRAKGAGGTQKQGFGGSSNTLKPFEGGDGGDANLSGAGGRGNDGGIASGGGGGGAGTGAAGGRGGDGGPGRVRVTVYGSLPL